LQYLKMPASIDPAILRDLSLEPSTIKIASHGGSGFASTFRITTTTTPPKTFFVKTSSSPGAATMFEGEHASLNAIHAGVPSLCPQSFAWGKMDQSPSHYFLATEFVDLGGAHSRSHRRSHTRSSKSGTSTNTRAPMSLAQKLAKLHTTPAPPLPPEPPKEEEGRHQTPTRQFGFPVTTCCGDTPQPNTFTTSWADFFAQNRLLFILRRGQSRNGGADDSSELATLVHETASKVVPRLLSPAHLGSITPVVVHGDLWSGNHGRGTFVGRSADQDGAGSDTDTAVDEEDIIYDPSSCYAHSEYELGIMRMFGGFDSAFMSEYHRLVPKTEPVAEYDDRVGLYEAYHHLNHWAIFGGAGYRRGAVGILKRLVEKYGGE
jgi:protein-ribulosamine 3-kinase